MQITFIFLTPLFINNAVKISIFHINIWFGTEFMKFLLVSYTPGLWTEIKQQFNQSCQHIEFNSRERL
jgi:hypothetical protein